MPGPRQEAAQQDLRARGDRIEALVDELRSSADPRTCDRAEELLRLVTELYGAGLARTVELAAGTAPALVDAMVADDLVGSLLLVHGLHPGSLAHRVEAALAQVRPFLASHGGDVELLELDEEAGAVRLRLLGSCDGCPSSAVTLQSAVEGAIVQAAPEIVCIDVDPSSPLGGAPIAAGGVPIALGTKPAYTECPTTLVGR
jgi:Fe-S cluster biogenesis protein NfuA